MSRFFDLVSKQARDMGTYASSAPKQSASKNPATLIRLDSNENPFGPSPRALEAMRSALAVTHSYPDDDCGELRRKLAEHHSLPTDQILVTAGSTAMLALLCQTLLGPGMNAVTSERSFIVYSMAVHATGAQFIEVPMRGDGIDLAGIVRAINDDTRIVFIANPNNPTGTMVEAREIDEFLAKVPGHVVVVLDEAYYDFASYFAKLRQVEYSKSLDYVRAGNSVVVLRTFSKAHGLAGLRVGYGLGPAELLTYCARMRSTFSVSSVAQTAALAALADQGYVGRVVSNNTTQAATLTESLSELGFVVVPTAANFIYCDVGGDAAGFAASMRNEGISVRPLASWGAPACVRISIGTPEQNRALLGAARKVVSASRLN